jgi:purine-nucleoside/S-methyl-5'-thioadenosine phosphorylase / adenosine deaminase
VARTPGHVCVIQVADCMPVLLAARDGSVIGAAHAGWRGLANGVLEATITAMNHDPADLLAWLGPAIGPAHFEVGDDVRDAFLRTAATRGGPAVHADNSAVRTRIEAAFTRNSRQRWQCDLYALARLRLETRGISQISGGDWCTYTDRTRFFSYRRDGRCGRMAALIWLAPS